MLGRTLGGSQGRVGGCQKRLAGRVASPGQGAGGALLRLGWRGGAACDTTGAEARAMATKVLLIGDDPKIVPLLQRGLAFEGFEVVTAMDGGAGLAAATTHHPQIVLLDIAMPGPDGLEACRRLPPAPD